MPTPRARTRAEAHLYIGLTPCPCGESELTPDVDVVEAGPPRLLRYFGDCPRCGRGREFFVEVTDVDAEDGYGSGRSELIDPGEWLLVSDLFHDNLRQLVESGEIADEQAPVIYDLLRTTASAVDQVLAFLPEDAPSVPETAFWTERGLAVRTARPERFDRDQLRAARMQRWRDVTDFEDAYGAAVGGDDEDDG